MGVGPRLDSWVDWVAQVQQMSPTFTPLFVVDTDDFRNLRRHRYLFEFVPTPEDVARADAPIAWPQFVDERIAEMMELYRPSLVLTVPSESEPGDNSSLASALRNAPRSQP